MLRTLAINSNQIVLSFGVLIAFWSPKQSKNEGELYIVHGKAFGSSNSWRTKLWSSIALCQSRSKYARKEHWREENRVKKTEDSSYSLLVHFWSTSWSPFSTFYIPFQSSGSQESNASNGAQFRVEMKELQPLEANHSKLKEAFCKVLRNHPFVAKWFRSLFVQCGVFPPEVARYMPQAGSWEPQDGSQLHSPTRITFCCEVISQPFCVSTKSRRHHFLLRNGP